MQSFWFCWRQVNRCVVVISICLSFAQDGEESAQIQLMKLARYWDDWLSDHNLHLHRIVESMRGQNLSNDEADLLSVSLSLFPSNKTAHHELVFEWGLTRSPLTLFWLFCGQTLVSGSNNMVISAYEAFAFDLDLAELQDTLQMIASTYV